MTRLNVNPTRQELRRLKGQLKTSVRGHKLLKDKSDEMIRQFCILIRENKRLREEVESDLALALTNFSSAKAVMDERALEEAFLMPSASVTLQCGQKGIMSVAVPDINVKSETKGNEPYAYAFVSSEVDYSVSALSALLPKLVQLAAVEKACNLLADEIEKNKRRVNALEYVMIPQYQETIRYIVMKLDENERGATTRLMKVKSMLAAEQE
ncbi:MAG: V-type ATP synthase subunit D [Clostridia bacterium]|nr:V-type ATP synthase subunit D [Clostridia bacterium]